MKQQKLISELKNAYYKVFKNTDPFGRMFNDIIKQRIILCPTDGYYLNKEQFNALMGASKALGEESCYLSETEGGFLDNSVEKDIYSFGCGEISNKISYEEYKKIKIVVESAIYSTKAYWGIIISHEDFAVVGGVDSFMESFKKLYPNWNHGYRNFVKVCEAWKMQYNSDLSWLPDFLEYINSN